MVSFSCNACQDTLKKPKLVQHFQRCHAPFTCLDCNKEMWDGEFQKHTTCISEAEKYEKSLYKGDKKKGKGQQQQQQQQQKQNAQAPQQSQPKPAKTAEAAPATAAPVPSTSVAIDNGTNATPKQSSTPAASADVKSATPEASESTPSKKDRKRKRKSEAAKSEDAESGNTTDAQIAKALVADAPAQQAEAVPEPPVVPATGAPEGKSEEKKSRKRSKKDKSKTASANGDTSLMQVDEPSANGASSASAPAETNTAPKVDLKESLASKVPEKGKSISLADALADLPADKIQEALAGLRVQRGKKDKFELTVGYA